MNLLQICCCYFILCLAFASLHVFAHKSSNILDVQHLKFPIHPFTKPLRYGSTGSEVTILQHLLLRATSRTQNDHQRHYQQPHHEGEDLSADIIESLKFGTFDNTTEYLLIQMQLQHQLTPISKKLTPKLAQFILQHYMEEDGYRDPFQGGKIQSLPHPYRYRVYIPVYRNRSIETMATLYDQHGNSRYRFKTRTHGQTPRNQLTNFGNTPTGLYTFDLNTPENEPRLFGPYDVNRAIDGLLGNALVVYPNIRSGILLHTGEWQNWNSSMPMPNSHGCIHAHPQDIKNIAKILKNEFNIEAHQNTFGKRPYPYQPQGLLSIELQN